MQLPCPTNTPASMAIRRLFRSPIRLRTRRQAKSRREPSSLVRLLLLLSGAFVVIPAKFVKATALIVSRFSCGVPVGTAHKKTLHDKRRASINLYRIDCHASTKASYIRTAKARHWKKFRDTSNNNNGIEQDSISARVMKKLKPLPERLNKAQGQPATCFSIIQSSYNFMLFLTLP